MPCAGSEWDGVNFPHSSHHKAVIYIRAEMLSERQVSADFNQIMLSSELGLFPQDRQCSWKESAQQE